MVAAEKQLRGSRLPSQETESAEQDAVARGRSGLLLCLVETLADRQFRPSALYVRKGKARACRTPVLLGRPHASALLRFRIWDGLAAALAHKRGPVEDRCTHRRGAFRGMRTFCFSNILNACFAIALDGDLLLGFTRHCADAAPVIAKASRAESSTCRSSSGRRSFSAKRAVKSRIHLSTKSHNLARAIGA
jgi:hypothetical protein